MATGNITANIYLTFRRDGTWSFTKGSGNSFAAFGMTGTNYYDLSTQKGGYWAAPQTATIGDNYEIDIVVSDLTSGIVETTSASLHTKRIRSAAYTFTAPPTGWIPLSTDRQIALNATDVETSYGSYSMSSNLTLECIARLQVVANIRKVGGTPITGNGTVFPMEVALRWLLSTGSGDGGGCVHEDSWITSTLQASAVTEGDLIYGMDENLEFLPVAVVYNRIPDIQRCLRILMSTGASVIVSDNTPLTLRDNSMVMSNELTVGKELPVRYDNGGPGFGLPFWDTVVGIEEMGFLPVRVINVGNRCYAAGEKPGMYVYTHNTNLNKN